jgi:hypothetical protein
VKLDRSNRVKFLGCKEAIVGMRIYYTAKSKKRRLTDTKWCLSLVHTHRVVQDSDCLVHWQ